MAGKHMTAKEVKELLAEKKIYQIINKNLVKSPVAISIRQAIELMQSKGSGYLVLTEGSRIKGLVTETTITNKVLGQNINLDAPVSTIMNAVPTTASQHDSVGEAIDLMAQHKCYHLPLVSEDNTLEGIISVRTIIRFLASFYPTEVYNLPPNADQIMNSPEGG
jgi:signal-transduction protein with cAMP-binding, CBS, and nucleotidyltransferase domain